MPMRRATESATDWASPVIIATRSPIAWSRCTASVDSGRISSSTRRPRARPSAPRSGTILTLRGPARPRVPLRATPRRLGEQPWATHERRAVDRGPGAAPRQRLELSGRRPDAMPRVRAPRTMARASGCSESASTAAAIASSSLVGRRCRGDASQRRLTAGQGAGLVEDDHLQVLGALERQPVLHQVRCGRRSSC